MSEGIETYGGYEVHPAATLYPMMDSESLAELAKDIQKNGLLLPVVIHLGKILDGRNRAAACELAGVKIKCTTLDKPEHMTATEWVLAVNSKRRHLTQSQKAMAAVGALVHIEKEREEMRKQGGTSATYQAARKSRDIAADAAGVSARLIQEAKHVADVAPEKIEQIKKGEKTIHTAQREIEQASKDIQSAAAGLKQFNLMDDIEKLKEKIRRFAGKYSDPIDRGAIAEELRGMADEIFPTEQETLTPTEKAA